MAVDGPFRRWLVDKNRKISTPITLAKGCPGLPTELRWIVHVADVFPTRRLRRCARCSKLRQMENHVANDLRHKTKYDKRPVALSSHMPRPLGKCKRKTSQRITGQHYACVWLCQGNSLCPKASGIRIWRAGAGRAAATILMMHLLRPMHKGCPMKPQAVPAALFFFVFAAVAYQLHLTKTLQMFIIVMQKETIEIKS